LVDVFSATCEAGTCHSGFLPVDWAGHAIKNGINEIILDTWVAIESIMKLTKGIMAN